MNYLGDESHFEKIRGDLLPPHPVSPLPELQYNYCMLGGIGLGGAARLDGVPALRVTLFGDSDPEIPCVVDIKHAHPWEETDEEMAAALRKMVSLQLTTSDQRTCTDSVVNRNYAYMMEHGLPFAMLTGWSKHPHAMGRFDAVTLTYCEEVGPKRSLGSFKAVLYDMVIGEVNGMFSEVSSPIDGHMSLARFPGPEDGLGKLSMPMLERSV